MTRTSRKEQKSAQTLPTATIHPNELGILESILSSYVVHVAIRNAHKPTQHLTELHLLKSRLRQLLSTQQLEGMFIPLTVNEIRLLYEATGGFIRLIRQNIPPSQEREQTIECVSLLRQRILSLLMHHR